MDGVRRLCRVLSSARGDERVPVELHEDSDPTRYRYRCPETFRRKYVAATEVAVYAVPVPMLLHVVADLLDVPQTLRRGIESPLLNGNLWKIGKARIGPAHTDIWFVRSLASCIDDVFRHFHAQTLPDQGLILSSGMVPPDFVRPPRNYRFASLHDVIVDYLPEPRMDVDLLHRILTSPGRRHASSRPAGALRRVHEHAHDPQQDQTLAHQGARARLPPSSTFTSRRATADGR
jgi:hypothetical protein